jgi:hypothetical protein
MVRYTDRERSTSNAERSTFKGLTERAHGGRDMGTDTELRRPGFCYGEPEQAPVGRSRPVLAPRYGDRHDVRYIALSQGERESWATGWVGQVVVAITKAGPDFVRSCMN